MLRTYKAVLKGNRIEWSDDAPTYLAPERAVAVQVTVLDEGPLSTGASNSRWGSILRFIFFTDIVISRMRYNFTQGNLDE